MVINIYTFGSSPYQDQDFSSKFAFASWAMQGSIHHGDLHLQSLWRIETLFAFIQKLLVKQICSNSSNYAVEQDPLETIVKI